ncbi:MAG: site-2 protease family protein [Myxococcales bacterium]|nr:site-2 protease family protein [Myxococcales bacterium]
MIGVLGAIVMIGVLITVHEFGHFVVAKLSGVKVEVFSIGFGSPIVKGKWGETEYRLAWVPVGGYVRLLGHDPTDAPEPEDAGRSLYDKPPLVRILISAAGPLMNILLPLWLIPPLVWLSSSYDTVPDNQIGGLDQGMPAYTAGLREGDAIVEIDGEPISAFWQIKREIDAYDADDGPLAIVVDRPGSGRLSFAVTPTARTRTDPLLGFTSTEYFIGYMPAFLSNLVAIADPSGPLAVAGVRTFDRVQSVDGQATPRYVDVERALVAVAPGQTVTLEVARDVPLDGPAAPLGSRFPFLQKVEALELAYTAPPAGGAPGIRTANTCIQTLDPDHPAAQVLRVGDCLLAVDGRAQSLGAFLGRELYNSPEESKSVTLLRDGETLTVSLAREQVTISDPFSGEQTVWLPGFTFPAGQVAVVPAPETDNTDRLAHGWYEARTNLARGFEQTLRVIGGLFTASVPANQLGGPLSIFYVAGESARRGIEDYIGMMVMLSLGIGLFNLLPVPLLDGGHILVAGVEMITRRPPSEQTRIRLMYVGLALILGLFVFATFNDIVRMVRVWTTG